MSGSSESMSGEEKKQFLQKKLCSNDVKIKKCECFQSRLIVPTTFLGKGDDGCFPDPNRLCHGVFPENAKWLPLLLLIDTKNLNFKRHLMFMLCSFPDINNYHLEFGLRQGLS